MNNKRFFSLLVLVLFSSSVFAFDIPFISSNVVENITTIFTPIPKEEKSRSPKWAKVRAEFLLTHSSCAVCGSKKDLEVHHIQPFQIRPDLELDPNNLITLCGGVKNFNHHLYIGHGGDFSDINPNVVKDAQYWNKLLKTRQIPKKVK